MKPYIVGLISLLLCLVLVSETFAEQPWREETVEIAGPQGPLQGTMLSPGDPITTRTLLLIIPGSGPTDRHGNSPQGLQGGIYRRLAEGLAERHIPSVRIDKRGLFGSAAAIPNANDVTLQDYANDVTQWAAALRQRTGVDCVWVLGHSEGGVVALMAKQPDPGLCGHILVSTPGRPLGQLLRNQLRANPANAPLLDQAFAAIDSLEAGRRVEMAALHPALRPLFRPSIQGFLIDSFAVDPAKLAGTTRGPLLIVQGARDLQVSVADARRLQASAQQAKLVELPTMNHVLKSVAGDDRAANVATYGQADLPLAPGVVEAIADFIASASPR